MSSASLAWVKDEPRHRGLLRLSGGSCTPPGPAAGYSRMLCSRIRACAGTAACCKQRARGSRLRQRHRRSTAPSLRLFKHQRLHCLRFARYLLEMCAICEKSAQVMRRFAFCDRTPACRCGTTNA